MEVHLWISSSAVDTDFTAKLVDVHPANEDYPDGFDMLLTDSIIRCRYREGFDREVLMTPGEVYPVTIALQATSNLFDVGHRIRVDISSSNWPRLDLNPNTGRADGPAHAPGRRGAGGLSRRRPPVPYRPAGDPGADMTEVEWCLVPAGPFSMGSDPGRAYPPGGRRGPAARRRRDAVSNRAHPGHERAIRGVRARRRGIGRRARWPAGTVPPGRSGVPVTYVSWHDARAFCAWAGATASERGRVGGCSERRRRAPLALG